MMDIQSLESILDQLFAKFCKYWIIYPAEQYCQFNLILLFYPFPFQSHYVPSFSSKISKWTLPLPYLATPFNHQVNFITLGSGFIYFHQSFTHSLRWNFLLYALLICWYLCLLFNVFSMSVIFYIKWYCISN